MRSKHTVFCNMLGTTVNFQTDKLVKLVTIFNNRWRFRQFKRYRRRCSLWVLHSLSCLSTVSVCCSQIANLLWKKMVYSIQQRIFLLLEFHRLEQSIVASRRSFQRKLNVIIGPKSNTIEYLFENADWGRERWTCWKYSATVHRNHRGQCSTCATGDPTASTGFHSTCYSCGPNKVSVHASCARVYIFIRTKFKLDKPELCFR